MSPVIDASTIDLRVDDAELDFCIVNGNRLFIIRALAGTPISDATVHSVARLCAAVDGEGTAVVQGTGSTLDFWFINPDGSIEAICGNALLAIGHLLGRPEIHVRTRELEARTCTIFASSESVAAVLAVRHEAHHIIDLIRPQWRRWDTGSPHFVSPVDDAAVVPTHMTDDPQTLDDGNVTWYQQIGARSFVVRTVERGVNAETGACATGAAAVGLDVRARLGLDDITVTYPGGSYVVRATDSFVTLSTLRAGIHCQPLSPRAEGRAGQL